MELFRSEQRGKKNKGTLKVDLFFKPQMFYNGHASHANCSGAECYITDL